MAERSDFAVLRAAAVLPPLRRKFIMQGAPRKPDPRRPDDRYSRMIDLTVARSITNPLVINAAGNVLYCSAASHAAALVLVKPSSGSQSIPFQRGRGEQLKEFDGLAVYWAAQTNPAGGTPFLYLTWCYDTPENPVNFA